MEQLLEDERRLPTANETQIKILVDLIDTPVGRMVVCATGQGICLLEFLKDEATQINFSYLEKRLNGRVVTGTNRHIVQVKQELNEYFSGERIHFDVSLNLMGTEFQLLVWEALRKIPFGKTTTYLQQAVNIGNDKAVRAVASANGKNKIAIIIPCHRVIGANGKLSGYAWGIDRKKWLLNFEKKTNGNSVPQLFDELDWIV